MSNKESIRHKFQYHPLDDQEQREKIKSIYEASWAFVEVILDTVPESSQRDVAVNKAKAAVLHAVEALRECSAKV